MEDGEMKSREELEAAFRQALWNYYAGFHFRAYPRSRGSSSRNQNMLIDALLDIAEKYADAAADEMLMIRLAPVHFMLDGAPETACGTQGRQGPDDCSDNPDEVSCRACIQAPQWRTAGQSPKPPAESATQVATGSDLHPVLRGTLTLGRRPKPPVPKDTPRPP
jgi:hypothetical protein